MAKIFLLLVMIAPYITASCNPNKSDMQGINSKNNTSDKSDLTPEKLSDTSNNYTSKNDTSSMENDKFVSEQSLDKIFFFAFYNCENLFDTEDDPITEDSEFTPDGKNKWNSGKLDKKLSNIAYAIKTMNQRQGPDVIGLAEIENYNILNRLNTDYLPNGVYGIAHFDSPDLRGIDVALLYRKSEFKLISKKAHRVDLGESESPTRDILEVTLERDSKQFTVLVNHWPSRRDGQLASEHKRVKAARVCAGIIDSLYKIDPNSDIVVMGDMNDEPSDKSLVDELDAEDFNKEKYLAQNNFNPRAINTAAKPAKNRDIGSHFYDKTWAILDQIIVSKGLLNSNGLVMFDMNESIFAPDFLRDDYNPRDRPPYRTFVGSKFIKGFSDHFPVYLKIGWKK